MSGRVYGRGRAPAADRMKINLITPGILAPDFETGGYERQTISSVAFREGIRRAGLLRGFM